MSGWDDLEGVTPWISNEDAESLLSGTLGVDEIHDLAPLDNVLNALRGPAESVELVGLDAAVAAFGAAVVTSQPDPSTARTRPMIKKLLSGKALAAIGAVTLATAGAAAAAGVVPTPFTSKPPAAISHEEADHDESTDEAVVVDTAYETTPTTDENDATEPSEAKVVSDAAGVDAAAADVDATDVDEADAADSTDGQGPDVNGPAKFGLCTAYQARTKHDDTTTTTEAAATVAAEPVSDDAEGDLPIPFQALSDAADAAGQSVADFCADAVPGGSSDAPGKSGDNPSATAPGKSGDNPSATAPGKSGDNPSGTAPGKSGDNPSGTAPGKSGGTPGNSGEDHGQPKTTKP